ncbi:HAD-IA family hydrolase [Flavobacterium sp.]|uniref:HAD family hydrolase n=1 Tax=Flavobacterium sp. TaxID=239 RepID=UPI002B4B15BD|nr:HAD-IA family hydrolase [Flavobacterium sp.]HLF51194.1 HAD-IA family hydrolase [Flavobacterium sp.]
MVKKSIIFDLDDTLYKEIDYLKSAYNEIAKRIAETSSDPIIAESIYSDLYGFYSQKKDAFSEVIQKYALNDISKEDLLEIYRNHYPSSIKLAIHDEIILKQLKAKGYKLGLITDGRSIQQRNKIKALNIEKYFEYILISEEFGTEKPNPENFRRFVDLFGESTFFYVADNTSKDFIAPKKMGWKTICLLDNGKNIHRQHFEIEEVYQPHFIINSLKEILNLI